MLTMIIAVVVIKSKKVIHSGKNNRLTPLRMSFILQRYRIGLRDEDEIKSTKHT